MIFDSREMAQLRRLEILASRVARGQIHGHREMARAGPGSGFREHRAYQEGDSLRVIDWNVYARSDQLVVKEFDAEEALDVVLIHDRSRSMEGAAATCAAKVTAALGAISLQRLDGAIWIPCGGDRSGSESYRGRGRLNDLLQTIDVQASGATDLLTPVQSQLPRAVRHGLAFVVSDFFDPRGAAQSLRFLLSRRFLVRAIQIEDPDALAPPAPGRYKMRDRETGATLKIDLTEEAIAAYQRTREARTRGLRAFCRKAGAGFLRARADRPFFEIIRTAIARGWFKR